MLSDVQLLKAMHTLPFSPTAPRAAAVGPGGQELLMPSNPDHQLPFPPSHESSSSLPFLLLWMFSPLLLSTFQFKTFALFPCPAEPFQVHKVSKEHLP